MSDPNNTNLLLGQIKGLVESMRDEQRIQGKRQDDMKDELARMGGKLEGVLTGQEMQGKAIEGLKTSVAGLDTRLRKVEVNAAKQGAIAGGAVAVGMALLVEGMKALMHRGGPH
ncbi:hypothetical protein ACFJGW_00635 [Burkholderiaceae bacterium UC74_6]